MRTIRGVAFYLMILPLLFWTWSGRYQASADTPDPAGDRSLTNVRNDSTNRTGDLPTRENSTATALLGHWATADGMTQYYLGQDQLIEINLLPDQERSPISHEQKLSYEVLAPNQADDLIRLQVETPLGWAQVRRLHLATDRQTFIETIDVMGHSFSNRWTYVDDRQQP